MPGTEDPDARMAYNGMEWSVGASVSAFFSDGVWRLRANIVVFAVDPYDWELYDVATGDPRPPKLPAPLGQLGFTHLDMARLHWTGLGREYQQYGTSPEIVTTLKMP